ncbi:RNA exonuclease 4-like isoform X1 [Chenopodium quinoa]|uniref:RNA exonuclease 4 n=1 Tax=Chenopodium quinoa TaxID=63459 RepID=A0A803LVK4_CHEQI|nr:RNA exonuclease 4-like isoform X1 [Chenopodium quinoa]
MGSEVVRKKKNPKMAPLNPNWALLQQKLNLQGSKPKLPSHSNGGSSPTILGKRKQRSVSESDESQVNVLAPTSSDCSLTDEVAMDCEMVGVSPQGNKSALGRVTLVNKWGNVVYDEFVRPIDRVVDFRTEISGIRPRDLRKAKDFPSVQKKVAELIKGKILVGHALRNDLKALLLSHPKKDLRDTAEYQPFLKESRRKALRHLAAEFLGAEIQNGEHCPIEDARAAMLLYQRHKKDWERSVKDRSRLMEKQKKRKNRKKSNKKVATEVKNVPVL